MHTCPMVNPGPVPHVGGPIMTGMMNVIIGGMPAARMGDSAICVGPPDAIALGSPTVLIGGQPAARVGDPTVHGGVIVMNCPTVIIGEAGGGGAGGGGFPFAVSINADGSIQFGNHIRIVGSPEFQAKTLADLVTIAATPSSDPTRDPAGLTTLNSINSGTHDVTIQETAGGNSCDAWLPGASDGNGSDAVVHFNPDREPPTAADPSVNRPADVGLHHELSHADHATHGQQDLTTPATNPNNPHMEEENTINRDNEYRNDRGIPTRADHTVL
jgi:uncharacterized Zn-binding protein involved in type VI secretion